MPNNLKSMKPFRIERTDYTNPEHWVYIPYKTRGEHYFVKSVARLLTCFEQNVAVLLWHCPLKEYSYKDVVPVEKRNGKWIVTGTALTTATITDIRCTAEAARMPWDDYRPRAGSRISKVLSSQRR